MVSCLVCGSCHHGNQTQLLGHANEQSFLAFSQLWYAALSLPSTSDCWTFFLLNVNGCTWRYKNYSLKMFALDDCFFYLQPVVDAFDPRILVAPSVSHTLNFTQIKVFVLPYPFLYLLEVVFSLGLCCFCCFSRTHFLCNDSSFFLCCFCIVVGSAILGCFWWSLCISLFKPWVIEGYILGRKASYMSNTFNKSS